MLPNKSIPLAAFTADERADFSKVLNIMRIEHSILVTFNISVVHEVDHEAMLVLLSEFNRGRIDKT